MDSCVDIGPSHEDLLQGKHCVVNLSKASDRNTDKMFGPKDCDLQLEIGEPYIFKISNKGTSMTD